MITPSASYSFTIRLAIANRPGMLGRVASAIGAAGGDIGAVDLVETTRERTQRDITVKARDSAHALQIVGRLKHVSGIRLGTISDRTFLMHVGGKIEIHNKVPIRSRDDLSMAYTPGVARVCLAIHEDRERAFSLTIKRNTIAVVTDGTAVLGLGDIGPEAALPVMEGKAMLFKELAGVDAFPVCLGTKDADKIVETVKLIAPGFGGINLEDIAAPRCFEIEERLRKDLDIPVFHDDQHGTAVVVLAALLNALRIVRKDLRRLRVVVTGVGAAGTATIKILQASGVRDIVGVDEHGCLHRGRTEGMDFMKRWVASSTNPRLVKGPLAAAMTGADVFVGLSVPGILGVKDLKRMARDPIVFAMANPEPEIRPEEAERHVRVMATGRSDYPNQINNVLCFPGFFRGLLDSRARTTNDEMKLAAARALAACVSRDEVGAEYIIPSVFNKAVAPAVAAGVARAAYDTGAARRRQSVDLSALR
ncbi:MAG: malate dehydrogenase [Candidatus Rokubacteria bacterium RIFCSPLOWO2_12_FULL_71_22]|nr:MAG: malate dehydrogenase [Candidatus Rokubacteria bacterium RIFCSPLOWO2_12_FULL_71_22]